MPLLAWCASGALVLGCSGEVATPIDLDNPPQLTDDTVDPMTDVTHPISPTPEMESLARQQCLDDPALEEGYVRAVDPETDQIMSEITVDCAEVREAG